MQSNSTALPTNNKDRLLPLALLAILTLATLLLLLNYPKYKVTGEELLENAALTENLSGWEQRGRSRAFSYNDGIATVTQDTHKDSSRLLQTLSGEELAGVYLISTNAGSNTIIAGTEDWQNGAIVLVRGDENNKRIGSEEIVGLQGTQPITKHKKIIEVAAPTAHITLTARILEATGELLVGSISLKRAIMQPAYPTIRTILIASWVSISLVLVVLHLLRFGITTPFVILCAITALAFAGTLMPKQLSIDLSASIANLLPAQFNLALKQTVDYFFPGYIGHSNQEISKLGHWVAFFCLTTLSTLFLRKTPIWYIIASALLIAAATETLQFLTSARTPHINDFLIDSAGVVAGLIIALPIRWMVKAK